MKRIVYILIFFHYYCYCQIVILDNDSSFTINNNNDIEDLNFDINLNLKFKDGKYKAIKNGSTIEGNIYNNRKIDTWLEYNNFSKIKKIKVYSADSNLTFYKRGKNKIKKVEYANKNERLEVSSNKGIVYYYYYIDSIDFFNFIEFDSIKNIKKNYCTLGSTMYGSYIEYYPNGLKKKEACFCVNGEKFNLDLKLSENILCKNKLCVLQYFDSSYNLLPKSTSQNYILLPRLYNSWDRKGNPITKWVKLGDKVFLYKYKNKKIELKKEYKYSELSSR